VNTPGPALRVDAARNADRIVEAAGIALEEVGPGVSLEEIARRAGVGVATVYRRFGNRDGLVRAVLARAFQSGVAGMTPTGDAWVDLAGTVTAVVDAFSAHRVALGLARGLFDVAAIDAYLATLDAPLRRARAAGVVRDELTARDVAAVVVMALAVVYAGGDAPDGVRRRRYLALLLDGMRPAPAPLPPA
jgi:AcrR family transcriptional regulator